MAAKPTDPVRALALLGSAIAAGVALFFGWRAFWFLTDDAFIAFRYAHNVLHGLGLVWNPPPFLPVEGYSSFLWVVLLAGIWGATGVEPPDAANGLSLAFGVATLLASWRLLERLPLPPALDRRRPLFIALAALGVVSNRTFLTWLSSGLETAMFNCWVVTWLLLATSRPPRSARSLAGLATVAALTALTRPDGLLYVGATIGLLIFEAPPRRRLRTWCAALPLAAVPAHLLWRRITYGAWLPNTYYAKQVAAWPESGLRYLASFVLEYGVWVWGLLLLAWLLRFLRASPTDDRWHGVRARAGTIVAVGTLVVHVGYYTLVVGGDHFEYRVYSHLVPLLYVSAVWLAGRTWDRTLPAALAVTAFVVASWPIGWVHWSETRHLHGREQTMDLIRPIADRFPGPLAPIVAQWDAWQAWLIGHRVCMRHQEHKEFLRFQQERWPSREEGLRITWQQRAILAWDTVGVPGWVMPGVAILDLYGLNDRVIAHGLLRDEAGGRRMAHDRGAPPGYIRCFRPNVLVSTRGDVRIEPGDGRRRTDERIRYCEAHGWITSGVRDGARQSLEPEIPMDRAMLCLQSEAGSRARPGMPAATARRSPRIDGPRHRSDSRAPSGAREST